VAYVSLIGTGATVGTGSRLVPIQLTNGTPVTKPAIAVGTFPDAIALSPDGLTAYVTNYASNTITPIDLETDQPEAAIPAGPGPAGIAITPNGATAYVTDDGSGGALGNKVMPIDLQTRKDLPPITVGAGPQGIAITPDGLTAYVTDAGAIPSLNQAGSPGTTVTPIDLAHRKAGRAIPVGNGPIAITITPGGQTAYVGNLDSQSVSPIDIASGTAGAPIPVAGAPAALVSTPQTVYVVDTPSNTNRSASFVSPISIATNTAGPPIKMPAGAQNIALAPGNHMAWVTSLPGDVTPISLATNRPGTPVSLAGGPFAIVITSIPQSGPGVTTPTTAAPKKKKAA
jgi:YVTN family beta-propeller protein